MHDHVEVTGSRRASRWLRDYELIARAVDALDAAGSATPSIAALAAELHVSTGHLHRTFARFAGTSPTRFTRWLVAGAAKELLRERRAVLDTAASLGLSSSGRLHDLCVTLDAVTPGEIGSGGAGLQIRVGVHPSPLGRVLVATTARGVLDLRFLDGSSGTDGEAVGGTGGEAADGADEARVALHVTWPDAEVLDDPDAGREAAAHLLAVLDGASVGRPMPVAAVGTNLQVKVWEALLHLPDASVVSYADLAAAVERPQAVRAVANAVGRNPVAALIPCHRVLRSSGELGGYRWGTTRKRILLAREAARVTEPASA
ncbi:MAG: methylated-DNA--[protein]-cysteine S-methyltransferase [Nitriliruptoraceae bacterium]|nr:methylated-DNA--[protein]-cysteine S-methyltransferase [Nitriliruptoraceae bacterium]